MFDKNTINTINTNKDFQPKNLSFKKILSTIILLIILLSVAGLLIYLKPLFNKKESIAEKKADILERVDIYIQEGKSLTSEEKEEIAKNLNDTKIQEYSFSKEEKIKILKALNN